MKINNKKYTFTSIEDLFNYLKNLEEENKEIECKTDEWSRITISFIAEFSKYFGEQDIFIRASEEEKKNFKREYNLADYHRIITIRINSLGYIKIYVTLEQGKEDLEEELNKIREQIKKKGL